MGGPEIPGLCIFFGKFFPLTEFVIRRTILRNFPHHIRLSHCKCFIWSETNFWLSGTERALLSFELKVSLQRVEVAVS